MISDVTLRPNVTTFTTPQPLCLPDLYNYMVFCLHKLTGYSGRNIHKHAVKPLSCPYAAYTHHFYRWTVSRIDQLGPDAALPSWWAISLLCKLNRAPAGLLVVISKHLLVRELKLSAWVHCGKVFSKKICTAHRECDWIKFSCLHICSLV